MNSPISKALRRGASQSSPATPSPPVVKTPRRPTQESDRITRSSARKQKENQDGYVASASVQTAPRNGGGTRSPKRKAAELEEDGAGSKSAESALEKGIQYLRDTLMNKGTPKKSNKKEQSAPLILDKPSPPEKQKASPKSTGHKSLPPHQTPCGHEIHPAHTDYKHPKCPTCRMTDAMSDVQEVQDVIIYVGGVSQLKHRSSERHQELFQGGCRRRKQTGAIDVNGNDSSYRSARVRLLNLVTGLKVLSSMEMAYEMKPRRTRAKPIPKKFSATNALSLYNAAADEGHWSKLEDAGTVRVLKRGWAFEELSREKDASPARLQTDGQHTIWEYLKIAEFDDEEPASKRARLSLSPVPGSPSKVRPRKNPAATVKLDKYAYQRKEADVDELRWAANSCSLDFLEDEPPSVVPVSILRTATNASLDAMTAEPYSEGLQAKPKGDPKKPKLGPKHKREHIMHLTKMADGSLRISGSYKRSVAARYQPGKWAVFRDSAYVDTGGSSFGKDFDTWDWILAQSQEEADEMDEALDYDASCTDKHADGYAAGMLRSPTKTIDPQRKKSLPNTEVEAAQQHIRPRLHGLRSAFKKTSVASSLGSMARALKPL